MVNVVSPVLIDEVGHTQVAGAQIEYEDVEFSLANDEGVLILAADFTIQMLSAGGDDALYAAYFTLDPNPGTRAISSGSASNTADDEEFWTPRIVKDLVTSGYTQFNGEVRRDFVWGDHAPGILTSQNISVGFNSNNAGGGMRARIFFVIVRLDDKELLQLVARRR